MKNCERKRKHQFVHFETCQYFILVFVNLSRVNKKTFNIQINIDKRLENHLIVNTIIILSLK